MIRRALSLFFFTFLMVIASAQSVPEITCVNVLSDTQTEIHWNQISFLDFLNAHPSCTVNSYLIWRANAIDGTFELIGSVPYTGTAVPLVFTDNDAQANAVARYYKIELEILLGNDCFGITSNTVAAMFLQYSTNGPGSEVSLTWNNENLTNGPNVILQKKVETGPWLDHFIANTSDDSYFELINNCHGSASSIEIFYRLKIAHISGDCEAFSNLVKGDFVDINAPDYPIIETITVDCATGNVVVYWFPSIAEDAGGYIIQTLNNDNDPITITDTFDGDQDSIAIVAPGLYDNPNLGQVGYYVLPFDDCIHSGLPGPEGNAGAIEFDTSFPKTIFMEAGYDVCTRSVQLNWTPYTNWLLGVDKYIIEGSIDNGPWEQLGIVQGNVDGLLIENVVENVEYCFVVKALPNDIISRESYSNKQCITTSYPEIAVNYNIENVTVVNNNQTEVTFSIDTDVEGARYRLEKLGQFGDEFESLGTYPQNVIAGGSLTITDFGVNNDNIGDEYRLIAIDSCLNEVGMSAISNSIHLEVFADDGEIDNILTWNQYLQWDAGVQEYQVFFSNTEQMPSEPKFVLGSQATFKMDDVDEYLQSESDFCYRIDAKEIGSDKISQSNIKCTTQSPLFYLPNAMVLNGQNRIWKPQGGFIEFETYEMAIYNRWGTLLFETKDFFEGWDGTYRGKQVREGVYAYFIKYREGGGKEQFRSGALTVLQAF